MAEPPLVGRKKELLDVVRLFVVEHAQLVTVTGPPGIGKSRFARAVAAELRERGCEVAIVDDADVGEARPALATSTQPRGLAGEIAYGLRRLPEAPAVELFRQRAEAADPTFDASYAEIAAACHRLGRVPREIERAAATPHEALSVD